MVPTELLEDSAFDIPSVIGAMLGERLGRILAEKFATGSGAATPRGIVTAATLGKTAAATNAITFDEVFDLIHSVDPAYRVGAGFLMHDNVILALRKLKAAGTGEYLWQSGAREGVPDRIAGYPLTVCQEMASVITNSAGMLCRTFLNQSICGMMPLQVSMIQVAHQ